MKNQQILKSIRHRRRLLKITQADLSELSGVSLRSIIAMEEGVANPSLTTLLKTLDVLGLTLSVTERVSYE